VAWKGSEGRTIKTGIMGTELTSTRIAYGETLLELGREREDIVVLDADLSSSTKTSMFGKEFPERFFNMGISEADMMTTAAGIAFSGKTVFASTFAIFATGRVWDQIRNGIVYAKANVKIVATHGGIAVGEDGASHQAIEDISLMRTIPGMRIIAPADANSTQKVIRYIAGEKGPFYVRLVRPYSPLIYKDCPFIFGKGIQLREGKDITLMAHGLMVTKCLTAADMLKDKGITARVFDMHTIKPIDKEAILNAASETRGIVVAEDHNIIGGLGSAVAEVTARLKPIPVKVVGIPDRFGVSGTPENLFEYFDLTPEHIIKEVEDILDRF